MKTMRWWRVLFPLAIAVMMAGPAAQAIDYTITTTVTPLPGGYNLYPNINNAGQVAWLNGGSGSGAPWQYYLYSGGSYNQISLPNCGPFTHGQSYYWGSPAPPQINNSGTVVMEGHQTVSPWYYPIYQYSNGSTQALVNQTTTEARFPAINDNGMVTYRWGNDYSNNLYSYNPTGQLTNNNPTNTERSEHSDINSAGQVAYSRHVGDGTGYSIYLYANGSSSLIAPGYWNSSIPDPAGYNQRYNWFPDINDAGEIVWWQYNWSPTSASYQVWLYSEGTTQLLDSAPGGQFPHINNRGEVVWTDPDGHIQLYSGGQIYDLGIIGYMPDINDYGVISAMDNSLYGNLFLASPVPLPPSVLLLGSGLLGLAALGRRRRS